ncbi:hypothetical protein F5148DRAFT_570433 [Russula earlei]|uniref:Uncharacterized protein n=1 Tax=Russula earlei TaxID=71964 RepID=A0ACC0UGQ2_9AGAM|nr:hypothetical protein F5148DRAFT_570433 [Russula earlei]
MGFFQKFLSLGSRKSKKRRAALSVETRSKPPTSSEDARRQHEEQEEIANRLLRSSSQRYAVMNQVDYSSLPPIPHPVNSLTLTSSASVSRSASVQTRRTYTVTIRDRKVEALTEFPNANPPLDTHPHSSHHRDDRSGQISKLQPVTPKDQNRLRMLRQDPSVASLLDMYDNKGCLDSTAFSNTPPTAEKDSTAIKGGHAQLKRGDSTLRQLLGDPESTSLTSSTEGDISWAERMLRERVLRDDQSTTSSFHLETPKDTVLGNDPFREIKPKISLSDSSHAIDPDPHRATISSTTVELSYTSEDNPALQPKHTTESESRPAAEVFGFLLEKRQARSPMPMKRQLSLTAHTSTPWDLKSSTGHVHGVPATPLNPKRSQSHSNRFRPGELPFSDTPSTVGSIVVDPPHTATILEHSRIPVVHGRPCEDSRAGQLTATAITTRVSRVPRGRRSLQLASGTQIPIFENHTSSTSLTKSVKQTVASTGRDDALRLVTNAVEQQSCVSPHLSSKYDVTFPLRSAHRRSVSYSSSRPGLDDRDAGHEALRMAHGRGSRLSVGNKENIMGTVENALHCSGNPKSRLPMTPNRERALRSSYPSPASSSELSPVGQKMMAELRKQRQARGERTKNRFAEAAVTYV